MLLLLNLSEEAIFLRKGEILGHLEKEDITIEENLLQKPCYNVRTWSLKNWTVVISVKEVFIASPCEW